MSSTDIPFLNLKLINFKYREDLILTFTNFLDSGKYILGDELKKFELEYANFSGSKYCVGVGNGLDALYIALKTLGIGKGDEVIVPSNTYIATWLAVTMTGARIIPVEPNIETFNLNPNLIEEKLTSKTRAIIPVHLFGQSCEMNEIMAIAKKHKLFVIEDNAQSQGAKCFGKITGSFGDINCTSFYPGKNLGALGDGGAITTNNKKYAKNSEIFRNYGSQKKYYNEQLGINSRLDELQASFLRLKLQNINLENLERNQIAEEYNKQLKGIGDIILPEVRLGCDSVYHLYVIRTDLRNELETFLSSKNIGTLIHYPLPPHLQKAYKMLKYKRGDFPIAELLAKTSLSLPIWPGMNKNQIDFVCSTIVSFYK